MWIGFQVVMDVLGQTCQKYWLSNNIMYLIDLHKKKKVADHRELPKLLPSLQPHTSSWRTRCCLVTRAVAAIYLTVSEICVCVYTKTFKESARALRAAACSLGNLRWMMKVHSRRRSFFLTSRLRNDWGNQCLKDWIANSSIDEFIVSLFHIHMSKQYFSQNKNIAVAKPEIFHETRTERFTGHLCRFCKCITSKTKVR